MIGETMVISRIIYTDRISVLPLHRLHVARLVNRYDGRTRPATIYGLTISIVWQYQNSAEVKRAKKELVM